VSINEGLVVKDPTVHLTLFASGATFMRVDLVDTNGDRTVDGFTDYATSKTVTLPSTTQGRKRVEAIFKDAAGNLSDIAAAETEYDSKAPADTRITVLGGEYVNSTTVNLELAATGATSMRISVDGALDSETWIEFATRKSMTAGWTGYGVRTVYAEFKDAAGNVSTPAASDTVTYDPDKPSGSVQINGNVARTASESVVLTLSSVSTDAAQIMISNDSGFSGGLWQDYASATIPWVLASGANADRWVYVKFKDLAGNESASSASDSIYLDKNAPGSPSITPVSQRSGSCLTQTADCAGFTTTRTVNLTLSASFESGETAKKMNISNTAVFTDTATAGSSGWIDYADSKTDWALPSADGTQKVYAVFRDDAGNISTIATGSIDVDTSKPVVKSVAIAGGAAYTKTDGVLVAIDASDTVTGLYKMKIARDSGFTGATWMASASSYSSWDLDGTADTIATSSRTVYVKVLDSAGNESLPVSASIVLDYGVPTISSFTIDTTAGLSPATTSSTGVTLTDSATDTPPGVLKEMRFAEGSSIPSGVPWEPYANSRPFVLTSANGTKTVQCEIRDAAGNTASTSDTIVLDTVAPTAVSLAVDGNGYTSTQNVALTLLGYDNLSVGTSLKAAFKVGTAPDCNATTGLTWQSFDGTCTAQTIPCMLRVASVDLVTTGTRTVYACMQDAAGNRTQSPLSATVVYDSVNPSTVSTPTASPGSREVLLSWTATTDTGGAGIAGYEVDYSLDSTFATGTSTLRDIATTSTTVTGLENRVQYSFRVRSVDRAGRLGTNSPTVSALTGFGSILASVPHKTLRTAQRSFPQITVTRGELWATLANDLNYGSGAQQQIYHCDMANSDCLVQTNWRHVGGTTGTFYDSANYTPETIPFVATYNRYFVSWIEGKDVTLRSCDRAADCDSVSNWTRTVVATEASSSDLVQRHVALGANGARVYLVYFKKSTSPSGYYPYVRTCDLGRDCPTASNWSAGIHLNPGTGTLVAAGFDEDGAAPAIDVSDDRMWLAYAGLDPADGTTKRISVVTCPTSKTCDSLDHYRRYMLGANRDAEPVFARTPDRLYLGYRNATPRNWCSPWTVQVRACGTGSDCDAATDWGTAATLASAYECVPPHFSIGYAGRTLHAAWWSNDSEKVGYANCPAPDPATEDCTVATKWRKATLDDSALRETRPRIAFFGELPVVTWVNSGLQLKAALPRIPAPFDYSAAPGDGSTDAADSTLRANWTPTGYVEGYAHKYAAYTSDTFPTWSLGGSSLLADGSIGSSTLTKDAATIWNSAVRSERGGQDGDDSRLVAVKPFTMGTVKPSTSFYYEACGADLPCAHYATAMNSRYLVLAYGGGATVKVALCDYTVNDCASGGWTKDVVVLTAASSFAEPVVAATDHGYGSGKGTVFVASTDASGGIPVFTQCDLTSGCDQSSEWDADRGSTTTQTQASLALSQTWSAETAYSVGDRRKNGTSVYECITAGTSSPSSAWAGNTVYAVGALRLNDGGKVYQCITAGTSLLTTYTAWANGTTYALGARRQNDGGNVYECITAGTSVSSTTSAWAASTAYTVGVIRKNTAGKVYQCTVAGTSAASGGPTGTGSDIVDGSVHWQYVGEMTGPAGRGSDIVDRGAHWKYMGNIAGPSGVGSDILDGTAHWDSVGTGASTGPSGMFSDITDYEAHWKYLAYEGVSDLAMTASAGGRIAIVGRSTAGAGYPNRLVLYECMNNASGYNMACGTAVNWFQTTIDDAASTGGHSISAGSDGFELMREDTTLTPPQLRRGYCAFASGCDAGSDWSFGSVRGGSMVTDSARIFANTNRQRPVYISVKNTMPKEVWVGYCTADAATCSSGSTYWSALPLDTIDTGNGFTTDIVERNGTLYALYATLNEGRLATCSFDCFTRDNWSIAPVARDSFMRESYRNLPVLHVDSSDRLYWAFVNNWDETARVYVKGKVILQP